MFEISRNRAIPYMTEKRSKAVFDCFDSFDSFDSFDPNVMSVTKKKGPR